MNSNVMLLSLSLVFLALAPIIYRYTTKFNKAWKLVDRLMRWSVIAIVVIHLVPESIHIAGYGCLLALAVGMFLPSLLERWSRAHEGRVHLASIFVSVAGLAVHAFMDGAALALPELHEHHHHPSDLHALPIAVVLHRLPVGLLILDLFGKRSTMALPVTLLIVNGVLTVGGFLFSTQWIVELHNSAQLAWFQALFSGTLLHVIVHRMPSSKCTHVHSH